MLVRARTTLSVGNDAPKQAGDIFEAEEVPALAWIKAGFVEAVKQAEPEKAVRHAPETAVAHRKTEPARKPTPPPKRKGR